MADEDLEAVMRLVSPALLRAPFFVGIVCTVPLMLRWTGMATMSVFGVDVALVLAGVVGGSWMVIVTVAVLQDAFQALERDIIGVFLVYSMLLGVYVGAVIGQLLGLSGVAGVVEQVAVYIVSVFVVGAFGGIVGNRILGNPRTALPAYLDKVQERADQW